MVGINYIYRWKLLEGEFMNLENVVLNEEVMQQHLTDEDSSYRPGVDGDQIGRSFYQLAKVHYDKADLKKAEELFLKSLNYAQLPRDFFFVFKTYGFLIRIASERLDGVRAQELITMAQKLFDEYETQLGTLNAEYFLSLGVLSNYKGNIAESVHVLEKTRELAKKENMPEVLAKSMYSLASIYFHQKEYDKSLEVLGELKQLLQIINKAYLRGSMNLLYGQVYSALKDYSMALFYYKKANFYFQVKRAWNQYGYILLGRANVHKFNGKVEEAMALYENALEFCEQGDFRRLKSILKKEIEELNESNVDIYLDRSNRKVYEKTLGMINFKHRFVLLEILFLLAQNPGKYFDKEVLSREIWKEEYNPLIHDKLIYTSISRLRKLIEPKNAKGEKRKYLIRGKDGYAFNPDVKISFHMNMKKSDEKMIANIEISDPV